MNNELENAIKLLAEMVKNNMKADDALKFTQAALNLAHVLHLQRNPSNNP